MESVKFFDTKVNSVLNIFKTNNVLKGILHLLIILYAARIAPTLPQNALNLFENTYFKLFAFFVILWTAQASPSTAILLSLAFLVSMNFANNKPLLEFLENIESPVPGVVDTIITNQSIAPTMEMAVDVAQIAVNDLSMTPVENVGQEQNTVIIQPKIIQTDQGQAVINPSVVIAPVVVMTPDGQNVTITPDVIMIKTQSEMDKILEQVPVQPNSEQVQQAPVMTVEPVAQEQKIELCATPRSYDISKVRSYDEDNFSPFGAFVSY